MTSINNNNEQKIQEILSRYKQGNKEIVDSIVEYTELSIFFKENSDNLTNAQKQRLHEQLKNYNTRNLTSGARYEKNSNSKCDKSTMYASKTYQLAGTNYCISIDVHPNVDGSGVTKLVDIYNPKTNERISVEDLVYRFNIGEGVAEEELSDFQKICRNIKNKYGCDFREYMSYYHFNGMDLSFNPPKKANSSGNTEVTSEEGVVNTSSADGLYNIKGEKIGDVKPIEENELNQKYAQAFNLILQRFNDAVSMFKGQQAESSIYTKFAEAFHFWGPSPSDAIKAIKNMEKDITTLRMDLELDDFSKFESDFKEIFGKSFDSESIQIYNEDCAFYQLVSQKQTVIDAFKQWNKDYFDKTYNNDITDETVDKLYNELLGLLGGNEEELQRLIGQAESKWRDNNQDNMNLPSLMDYGWYNIKDNTRKCAYLKIVVKDMISNLEEYLQYTTDGKSFNEVKQRHQALYEKAFGTKNDAFKTVESCCEYQQIGTQITRGIVMAGALITVGVASGGLAFVTVPLATYGTDIVVSATDEATKNKALNILNTKGPAAYLDHMIEDVNWGEICSQAKTNATMSVLFMGQAHVISNVCRIAGTAAGLGEKAILGMTMGSQMVGDAALGSALEYAATGEITVNGVVFIVVMDIVGNAVHIKDYHRKTSSPETKSQDLGFNQNKAPKLSKECKTIEAELEATSSSNQMQTIEQNIRNNKKISSAEKEYLQQKFKTKMEEVQRSEAEFNELKQIIQELSNPDELNRLSVEINNPDRNLSYKQRQALVDMASDKIEEFVQKGEIDPTEIDLHYNALTSWAKAGAGMPEIVSECYSGESVEKMAAYLAKKTSNPDLYYDAIGKITEKILTGEVPSKTMLDELVVQIKKQVGGSTSDIRNILLGALNKIDEMKCFVNAGYFDSKSISSSSPGYRRNIERFKSSLKNKTDVGAEKKSSEKVEQKTESKVESKSNNTNETPELFSESEQKIIRQSATDTNFEILQNAINEIIELMKAGKIPDLEFIEALATKYRVRPSDLKSDLIYALKKLGSINKNYFDLRNACVTSNKNELPAATIDGLNNFMREKNIKFNDGVEKIKSPQKESVEPVKTYDIRESAEYKQYSEKYPELKEIPFRDDNSLIKAGKAMEKYEHYLKDNEITYENFDEADLYQRLSDIENGTDAENVVNVMKNKYHSDVVAEQNRIENLKSKYSLDDEQIKISDKIISKIKKMQANEEPYTVDDINTMIEDAQGYNDIMNERVRKRILDDIKI